MRARCLRYVFVCFYDPENHDILQAQADVQHLWFGRRASTRIRSELMAAIYDKALKRKDFSGITNKDKKEDGVKEPESGTDAKESKRLSFLEIKRRHRYSRYNRQNQSTEEGREGEGSEG